MPATQRKIARFGKNRPPDPGAALLAWTTPSMHRPPAGRQRLAVVCSVAASRHGRNLQSTGWCCLLSCSALETLWLGRNLQSTGSHAADGSLLLLLSSGPRRSGSSLAWTAASHHGSWDRCRRWTWTTSQHVPIGRPALPATQRKIARFGKNRPPVLLC